MPQKAKVTLPEGTGPWTEFLAEFWAVPDGTEQAMPAIVAADKRKRQRRSFMGEGLVIYVWGVEGCGAEAFELVQN